MLLLSSLLLAAGLGAAPELPPAAPDTLRVVLVRHGQAFTNLDPEPDLPPEQLDRLTALGHTQARAAGEALRGLGVKYVVSSPMGRARETAAEIAGVLVLPGVTVDARLRPLEMGQSADGQQLDVKERWAEWKAGRDPVPLQGESLEQVSERVLALMREQQAAFGAGSVVLVAHSEVIGTVIGKLRGVPAPQRFPPAVPNCSLTVVDVGPDGEGQLLAEAVKPDAQAAAAR